jgi:hypothetical protein
MNLFQWSNKKIKTLDWLDVKLIKLGTAAITLLLAKWFPILLSLDWYWYLILASAIIIRPMYKIFFKMQK